MDSNDVEARVKNIDERTQRIEQILPTLATKEDLKAFPTRDEVRDEGERTRQHFNAVAERIEESVRLIAEGHVELDKRLTRVEKRR